MRGISGPVEGYIYYAYLDWLYTQTGTSPQPHQYTWLRNVKRLHAGRAPGNTCLSALSSGVCGTIEKPINNSKGCGGVMRAAPIGLYFCEHNDEAYVTELGAKAAAITHGHPLGFIPAATLVNIVYNCLRGGFDAFKEVVEHSIGFTADLYARYPENGYLISLLEKAVRLSENGDKDINNIETLGEGWVAEEALAVAVYCALRYPGDFEKAIVASVNHSGDSDSTGAITGNILGAWLGIEAIPQHFKEGLELTDVIEEIAKDLYNDCQMSEYSACRDDTWESKYINTTFIL